MFSVRTDVRTGAGTFASRSWSLVDRGEVVRGDTGFYVNISYHMPTQGFGGVARVARQTVLPRKHVAASRPDVSCKKCSVRRGTL